MCGIAGFFDVANASDLTKQALIQLRARGKEAAGIWDGIATIAQTPIELPYSGSDRALGHVLHAMVGCVAQPLEGRGVLIANCEIYNWHELARANAPSARNDAEVLLQMLDATEDPLSILPLLDGVYAFAYYREETLWLVRDPLGVKPLWYSTEAGFCFASERSTLESLGRTAVRELHPRSILEYRKGSMHIVQRPALALFEPTTESYAAQLTQCTELLRDAVQKRIPDAPYALLLSGGLDSAILAALLKEKETKVRCYVVGTQTSADVKQARKLAQEFGVDLQVVHPTDVLASAQEVVQILGECDPVKISAGMVLFLGAQAAARDGMRALISGGGADELFCGLSRHKKSTAPRKEIVASLRKLHERELYAADVLTMRHGIELRLPYLDRTVVNQALHLPRESTWDGTTDKKILRTLAQNLGVPVAIAQRPRRAPQHGSGILTALERSAHAQQTSLAALLQSMLGRRGKRVAALLSGGKDSVYALHVMDALRYDVVCAITIESQNPDSYMYHTPNISLAQMQAQALHLPHITAQTKGIPEEELDALRSALQSAQKQYHIDGVCTGAIQSQYQRERIERVAEELGLTVWSPLWQMDQLAEIRAIVQLGINAVFVKVAAEGLDSTWLAKNLDAQAIQSLAALHKRIGLHPAGEGGEYETFVTDAPLFAQRIVLSDTEIVKDGLAATLVVRGARLEEK